MVGRSVPEKYFPKDSEIARDGRLFVRYTYTMNLYALKANVWTLSQMQWLDEAMLTCLQNI